MEEKKEITFGKLLYQYRSNTRDNQRMGCLSRDRFGMELTKVLETRLITHDVIYKLENDLTKFRYQDRNIVKGIIIVLLKFKGISKIEEANRLLMLAKNSPLLEEEIRLINQDWLPPQKPSLPVETPTDPGSYIQGRPYFNQYFEEQKAEYSATAQRQRRTPLGAAPAVPSLFIGRAEDMKELKKRLGIGRDKEEGIQVITAMRGWPGVGKTTTAAALAYDVEVMDHYKDGVLWTSLGTHPLILPKLAEWGRALNYPEIMTAQTSQEASHLLASILRDKQILMIIDDVWGASDIKPFLIGGPKCGMIVTTRETALANLITSPDHVYPLRELSFENALKLFQKTAPDVYASHAVECEELVKNLEGLPLAILVAGKLLQSEWVSGLPLDGLFKEMREGYLLLQSSAPIENLDLLSETTPSVASVLLTSIEHLSERSKMCFASLGVFAEIPATFGKENISYLWNEILHDQSVDSVIKELINHGLIEYIPERDRYQMHALLIKLAQSLLDMS